MRCLKVYRPTCLGILKACYFLFLAEQDVSSAGTQKVAVRFDEWSFWEVRLPGTVKH